MVYFHYYNIHTARSSFSFHTTRRHSNKAVQQSVQLIATHINDKTQILIERSKMQCRKGVKNENISNGLFSFERYILKTATMCAYTFP